MVVVVVVGVVYLYMKLRLNKPLELFLFIFRAKLDFTGSLDRRFGQAQHSNYSQSPPLGFEMVTPLGGSGTMII